MRALVLGASGQVGGLLMRRLASRVETFGTGFRPSSYPSIDLADSVAVDAYIHRIQPTHIFVPAGITAVDACESQFEAAWRICVDGTRTIQQTANRIGAFVVHFSTDFIYSGDHGPYTESACADPISAYGRIRLAAEQAAQEAGGDFAIARTSMVYSDDLSGKNFVSFIRNNLSSGRSIKAFTDQAGSPTLAEDLASATIEVAERRLSGIWNLSGPEVMTRHAWAAQVARHFGLPEEMIEAVNSQSFVLPARRPGLQGGFNTQKAQRTLNSKFQSLCDALTRFAR